MDPLFSIIIPTKNGETTIGACLESIFAQNLIESSEVIIIDSCSEDKTLEIAGQFPVTIHRIRPEQFGHGRTRNLGVSLARGNYLLFTVQDARLAQDDTLERALKHFSDPEVQAVGGIQVVPHDKDKNPLQWYRPVSKPQLVTLEPEMYNTLSERQKYYYARLDNVIAFYRRSTLQELAFDDVQFGEDLLWAHKALLMGWKIIIDQRIKAYHYHDYRKRDLRKRRTQEKELAGKFGVNPRTFTMQKVGELIRIFYLVFLKKGFVPERKLHWLLYNLRLWL